MSSFDNIDFTSIDANKKIEKEMFTQEVRKEVLKKFKEYEKSMIFMASDAPISILCLPKVIEKSLINHGCLRVYDLLNCDLTKIKGLGDVRLRNLTSRLNEFTSMF